MNNPPAGSLHRSRLLYAVMAVLVIGIGLLWRSRWNPMPLMMFKYGGDALWAVVVFLGFAWVFHRASTMRIALLALAFAWSVEFLQLYKAGWIEAIRATRMGRLVLGSTFNPLDLLAYLAGILLGVWAESRVTIGRSQRSPGSR